MRDVEDIRVARGARLEREPAGADARAAEPDPARTAGLEAAPADTDARADDETLRFDDPFWDDAFCAWGDPTLRTCCS